MVGRHPPFVSLAEKEVSEEEGNQKDCTKLVLKNKTKGKQEEMTSLTAKAFKSYRVDKHTGMDS